MKLLIRPALLTLMENVPDATLAAGWVLMVPAAHSNAW
jgi:hypothetical protein